MVSRLGELFLGEFLFAMTQNPQQFAKLEAHARRRFRARLASNLKCPRNIAKAIVKAGFSKKSAKRVAWSNKAWWALSHDRAFERMYPNRWFEELGMFIKSKETHDHWFEVKDRICFS